MEVDSDPVTDILQLPDPCLLAVLQCLADDPRSLFSAARAHSRLHQAAVLALRSIRAVVKQQQQADSLLQYLGKHGQQVASADIEGVEGDTWGKQDATVTLGQLPHSTLQGLTSLSLCQLNVSLCELVPSGPPRLPLRRLALLKCHLVDEVSGLEAALAQLHDLERLSIHGASRGLHSLVLPGGQLCWPQRLSHLELSGCMLNSAGGLQFVQPLTRLQDLRLQSGHHPIIKAAWFSGLQHLTRLEVRASLWDPGALAGKAQLQHLDLQGLRILQGPPGVAQLLSHLQELQQLTFLSLRGGLTGGAAAPLSAYSALTASSRLQHLDLDFCSLPAGVWQHLLPAGRQLPHLTALSIMGVNLLAGQQPQQQGEGAEAPPDAAAAPEASRLVSCCPGLQSLHMNSLRLADAQLLTGLLSLQDLSISSTDASALAAVCQITQLRQLSCWHEGEQDHFGDGLLLQLTQLRQLTRLRYEHWEGAVMPVSLKSQAPGSEPVWRQLLQHHLQHHKDPAVVEQAATALRAPE